MEIIVYSGIGNSKKDNLIKSITQVISPTPVMIFDFEGLFNLLKSKISGQVVIVFLISSIKELTYLNTNKFHLSDTRNIIILPDNDGELVSKALSLYPRYLAYTSHNFEDVSAVLNKMIQNSALNKNTELYIKRRTK